MLDALIRTIPLSAWRPLRQAIFDLKRGHPGRLAATALLRRAARAHRLRLSGQLAEIRPVDMPDLSFEPADSMVMDAVYWFGVRGYEGVVARTWIGLCGKARSVLEIGGNVGLFSVIGGRAAPGAYTVVEPVPAVAAMLRANLARNNLTRVEVLQAAVVAGDGPRTVQMNLPDEGRLMPVGAHLLDGVEVQERSSLTHMSVQGLPIRHLAQGRDLIKIDAEGIEAVLLADIRDMLVTDHPTLLIEILPEAVQLGALIATIAQQAGYSIYILPEYGSDEIVTVPPASFTSKLPGHYNAKDIVLSVRGLA